MTQREPGVERVIASKNVFQGRICSVRVDKVALDNGRTATREIVEHEPVVVIVPITYEGDIIMVRQYRLATGRVLLELPAGIVDNHDGGDIAAAAQRELQEEIGMRARELTPIGEFYASPGFLTEYMHVFLARGLEESPLDPDEDEDIVIERMPFAQLSRNGRYHRREKRGRYPAGCPAHLAEVTSGLRCPP